MAQTHNVDIKNMAFNPASTTIAKGDTVTWTNRMAMDHTATADGGQFDSGNIKASKTYSHTFNSAGAVGYHCEIHPFMTGTITVT